MENKNYSIVFRLLHWSIAICIFIILITIFLRMTWMNKHHVAGIIQDYLATTNQTLAYDDITLLAKQIRRPMWNWHIYIGYILVGYFLFLYLELIKLTIHLIRIYHLKRNFNIGYI